MSDTLVARRYAQALYEEAEAAGSAERVADDMRALRDAIEASRDLQRLFQSPVIPTARKKAVLKRLLKDRFDDQVVRLVDLLVSKGREGLLPNVVAAYAALRDERLGRVEAHVRTAMELGQEQVADLKDALERTTGREVVLRVELDPALISGLVVRVGDTVYDGSARNHLANLREQFAARTFLSN